MPIAILSFGVVVDVISLAELAASDWYPKYPELAG
jgi:hypothetical protein